MTQDLVGKKDKEVISDAVFKYRLDNELFKKGKLKKTGYYDTEEFKTAKNRFISDELADDSNSNVVKRGMYKFFMDGYLVANLFNLVRNVHKDYDAFVIISGREGFGKSTLANQAALFCDKTYNIDRCVFTADQFMEAVECAKKYQAIVFDETMGYLSSRGAMSKFNRTLIKVMAEMRSKNLFIFLCIPNFFEMDRYPAMHRSTGLLHVYRRGRLGSYDYKTKKKLYLKGKKYYSYNVPPNFIGQFAKMFPMNKEAYEKKKQEAINQWSADKKEKEKPKNTDD